VILCIPFDQQWFILKIYDSTVPVHFGTFAIK